MTKTKNLMEALLDELNRNRELLKEYESIGSAGQFGAHFIKTAIKRGEQAIVDNDVVEILRAYNELKENN